MRHCLPPLKKKRQQASVFLFRTQSLFGQHTAPLIPVDCLKSGNHLHSAQQVAIPCYSIRQRFSVP